MASEWQDTTLGEVVNLKRGYDLPAKQRSPGPFPIISSSGISDFHAQPMVKGPGVVTGRYGTIGKVFYHEGDFFPLNTTLYVESFKGNDPRFIYYLLQTIDYQKYSDKAAVPGVNRNHLHTAKVSLPGIEEQRQIVSGLKPLDDKIALLCEINATLETIAQAIFKSWFMDFDPVRAKAEGRDPEGLPLEVAELFPSEFEDSELGAIPKGWRVAAIKDIASQIQYGLTQSASLDPVGPRFLRITDIQGGKVEWDKVPFCLVSEKEYAKYKIMPHDILVARTGASTGENIYIPMAPDSVFASYLVRFQFDRQGFARLVGAFMRTQNYFDYVGACRGGSAQPNASAQALAGARLVIPTEGIADQFSKLIAPMDAQRVANQDTLSTLTDLRDTLLPRLMSGKLRIADVEEALV